MKNIYLKIEAYLCWLYPSFGLSLYKRIIRSVGWTMYKVRRYFEGARKVPYSGNSDGFIKAHGLEIEFSGNSPVQGFGVLDGKECYYRSRGSGWSFEVESGNKTWKYSENNYFWPDGGYVDYFVSENCILRAVSMYRLENCKT